MPLFFIAREARKHVKVVLSGEGADELFGGYTIYREPLSLKTVRLSPRPVRRRWSRASQPLPEGMRGKSLLHRGSLTLEERYYGNARSFSDDHLRAVLPTSTRLDPHRRHRRPIYAESAGWDPVARMQHIDLFTWLRGDIPQGRQDDDGQLAGVAGAVPGPRGVRGGLPAAFDQKITRTTTKYALCAALEPIVPPTY